MKAWRFVGGVSRFVRTCSAAIVLTVIEPATLTAQTGAGAASSSGSVVTANAAAPASSAPISEIIQTGCTSCGGAGMGDGCDWWCRPDASPYCQSGCAPDSCVGKFLYGFYECLCCQDPCYDPPKWLAVADAGFFIDAARPITQTRIRVDSMRDFRNVDRAEYYWARINPDCKTEVASCRPLPPKGKGVNYIPDSVDMNDLSLYTEAGTARASFFIEIPYRHIDANLSDVCRPTDYCEESGFVDMNLGTKSLLCDCELFQLTFQFKTYVPSGNFLKGFGTGHVSLEPALLYNLNLGGTTYLQGMSAYWIPIGGDAVYQANIWHNHWSLNHLLCCPCKGFQVIGTLELNEWKIYGGAFTTDRVIRQENNRPVIAGESASTVMAAAGPGLRLVFCDKIDTGVACMFGFTGHRWYDELIRWELRWRY